MIKLYINFPDFNLIFNFFILPIFKDHWIVLKIEKTRDKDLLYTIFTKEYWKIKANKKFSKKEKTLDLGYIINFEIHTKEWKNIHKIHNIKIKSEFNTLKDKNFAELNTYLEILGKIHNEIPDWLQNKEVFKLIEIINSHKKIDETRLILAKIKLKAILWELKIENYDKVIEKILKFVTNSKIEDILKLKGISEEIKEKLKKI
jgi:hypothetical protein